MTNDLSTLNGALLEMKDQLIYELGQKGVTASYSSSDGLLGLIGKISEIQTGGGSCYHIELDNSSYTTTGSLTVTATLQNQYQPYANQTITFTGGTSTVTTTTDSNGVATATVTFSASGTLTATYSNVSDTATVTVQSYIYAPTLDGTETWYKINSSYTPTYSTVSGVNQVCDACGYLSDGWDNTINWKLTFEYYYSYNRWGDSGALVTFNNVTARDRNSLQFWGEALFSHQGTGSTTVVNSQTVLVSGQWNKVEITKNGSNLTIVINDTNTYNVTNTDFSNSSRTRAVIGLDNTGNNNNSCIRNIKVEAL